MPHEARSLVTADAAAFAVARGICRRHGKSFFFASHFLPQAKRDAAYAVYAFCRLVDDAIDEPAGAPASVPEPSVADRLALFRRRLDAIYDCAKMLPAVEARSAVEHVLHALSVTVRRYGIPQENFSDLADGCGMDLSISRYQTWPALEGYCYRVAGVVGLIMSCIFGAGQAEAGRAAVAMGNAMQLTNILRDIREDWDRGRVYLPQEDLHRFGYSEEELGRGVVNSAFRNLMAFEIDRARALYRDGADGLHLLAPDGSRLTASGMACLYSGILDAIEQRGYDVFSGRAHLSTLQKMMRLPLARRLARAREGSPLPLEWRLSVGS